MLGLGNLRARLARLAKLIGEPKPEPCDPRLARAFLCAVPDCGCPYMGPHTCGRFDDRYGPWDPPDWDAEWLKPAWEALHEMEAMIASGTAPPIESYRVGDESDDDDDA